MLLYITTRYKAIYFSSLPILNTWLHLDRLSLGNMKLKQILMSYYINDGDMAVRIVTGNKLIKEAFFTSPRKYSSFIVMNLNDSRHTG